MKLTQQELLALGPEARAQIARELGRQAPRGGREEPGHQDAGISHEGEDAAGKIRD